MPSQEDIDKKLAEYFSRLDPLAAGILAEIEAVKSECTKWDELSQKQRDDLIDNHFIPHDVKSTYRNKKSVLEGDFPHRIMETGQKYHGSNGLVRDEFSSPFHWETQSQMETFYTMDKIEIPADQRESLKQKTQKNKSFITKLNNQLISSKPDNKPKSQKSKPLPPPRAPTTRRQSNISNFSSSTASASINSFNSKKTASASASTNDKFLESLADARKYNSATTPFFAVLSSKSSSPDSNKQLTTTVKAEINRDDSTLTPRISDPSTGLTNSSTSGTLNSFATPPSHFSPSSDRHPLTASSPKTSRSNSHENKTSELDDFTDVTSIENFSETEELIHAPKKEPKPYEFLLNW